MKKYIKAIWMVFVPLMLVTWSCEPNKDLYAELDELKPAHNEAIHYTLVDADYNRFGGVISQHGAFNDTMQAMDFVPDILKVRFVSLRQNSSALVTFNHFLLEPIWWEAGFGYELTEQDYANLGVGGSFTPNNPAYYHLPFFLLKEYPNAAAGQVKNIIYMFTEAGETNPAKDTYEFDGTDWVLQESVTNLPYIGYELTEDDYDTFGGNIARFNNFSETFSPEKHLPAFLRNFNPMAVEGDEQVLRFNYHDGSMVVQRTDLYAFDGVVWSKVPYVEERTEQYIFGALGWAFDPTVFRRLTRDDYMHLAEIDPIPHPVYSDFGYYYGASAFYSNFDIRLIGRRLNKNEEGNYWDPELGTIYENEGSDAAMAEMARRINEEGIIKLLQYRYPDATPQVGGIDVHYFIDFETFADNWVRRYPRVEYICTAAGNPPQFELVGAVK